MVAGGKLFLQTASVDGATRSLLCLDAATGKTVWSADAPGQMARTHKKNSLASGTPAVDAERVYCLWWDGDALTLAAYTLDGKSAWATPLGAYRSDHGAGHSPVVYGGRVFVNNDGSDDLGGKAELQAFDAAHRPAGVGRPAEGVPGQLLDAPGGRAAGQAGRAGGRHHVGHHRLRPGHRPGGVEPRHGVGQRGHAAAGDRPPGVCGRQGRVRVRRRRRVAVHGGP